MTRYIAIAALAGCMMLGALAWHWQRRAEAVAAELLSARAQLSQRAEADAVHRAYIARLEDERSRWDALTRDLQDMEGRDAPLSDHLRRAAGRLWP